MRAFQGIEKECGCVAKSAQVPLIKITFARKHIQVKIPGQAGDDESGLFFVFLLLLQFLEGFFGEDCEEFTLAVFEEL